MNKDAWRRFDRQHGHEEHRVKIDILACLRMWARWKTRAIRDRLKWRKRTEDARRADAQWDEAFPEKAKREQLLKEELIERLKQEFNRRKERKS